MAREYTFENSNRNAYLIFWYVEDSHLESKYIFKKWLTLQLCQEGVIKE